MIGVSGREGIEKFYSRKLVGRAQTASQTLKDVIWEYKVGAETSACKLGCTDLGLAPMTCPCELLHHGQHLQGKYNLSAMDEDAWLTRKHLIMNHITSKGRAERYLQVWHCRQLAAAAEARLWARSGIQLATAYSSLW